MSPKILFLSLWLLMAAAADEAATKSEPIPVTEPARIEAQLGKKATIRGKVTRTGQSKGGLQFINFANAQFVVVCFPDAVAKFAKGEPVGIFKDTTVEITGDIVQYRDKFQIKLESPDQIKVVKAEPAATEPAESKAPKKPAKPKAKEGNADKKPVDPKKFFDC